MAASVRRLMSGRPEPGIHPNKKARERECGGVRDWENFWPPCEAIHNRQKVRERLRRRKGSYHVDVEMFESTMNRREIVKRSANMASCIGPLAGDARTGPQRGVRSDPRPHKFGRQHAARCADTRVREAMNCVKNLTPAGGWHHGHGTPKISQIIVALVSDVT